MRNHKRFVCILLLSSSLPIAGWAEERDSLSIHVEPVSSAGVIEHRVPFETFNDIPLVKCRLNGNRAVPFLVDTGASTNILDHAYARAIGIVSTSKEYLSLQGYPMQDASIDELKIATFRSENVHVRTMDARSVLSDDCPAKGILGYPLFRRLELCVDYPKRTISFRERAWRRLGRSFDPVFTFVIVPVLVENQGPFNFIFDTGCNMSLVEPHVLAALNPPKEAAPVVRIEVEGPGAGFAWPRKRRGHRSGGISDAREFVRRACGIRIDGVLGWRHMKDCRVVIDYPTCTYQFERTGYPPELKPVVVSVTPDLSRGVHLPVDEIIFEFSVPMRQVSSFLSTFHCEHRWRDDRRFKLINLEGLEVDKEYEIILGQGFHSNKGVPLDWSPHRFKVAPDQ